MAPGVAAKRGSEVSLRSRFERDKQARFQLTACPSMNRSTDPTQITAHGSPPSSDSGVPRTPTGYTLLVVSESGVKTAGLVGDRFVILGRNPDTCEIVIDSPSVSREHAVIRNGDPPTVEDLGSTNGTRIGGKRLEPKKRYPLNVGSVVEVGGSTVFLKKRERRARHGNISESTASTFARKGGIIVRDPLMQALHKQVRTVAGSPMRALILGETGSGKEHMAEMVHHYSSRREAPLLRINCAALSESLLDSELFGHERGAFTGAHAAREGLFEAADGGTLFLDEVGELPLQTQAKLLRVLERGEVTRLGATAPRRVDVRIVSATNRDLRQMVAEGKFRPDLLYRLNGVTLVIPPLRDRPLDILPLADCFAANFAESIGRAHPTFSPEARQLLQAHYWHGNIRELRNTVERAVLLAAEGTIEPESIQLESDIRYQPGLPAGHNSDDRLDISFTNDASHSVPPGDRPTGPLPGPGGGSDPTPHVPISLKSQMEVVERKKIIDALAVAPTQADAAKMLGISRRTLLNRLDQYQIERPRKRNRS